jgi:hypothetical protein
MSTEATGDPQADAVSAVKPVTPAESTEPAAAAVTEPAVAAAAPAEAGQSPDPAELGEPAELNEIDEPDELDERGEPGPDDENYGDEPDEGEPDETDELDERYDGYAAGEAIEYDAVYQEYDEYEQEQAAGPPRARRWPRVLLGLGFVALAAVIVGGAIAIVGSVTHGFKKPVKITYTKSALFNLKTGECFDPHGQSYTLISCDSPHVAEVFATFKLSGSKWPGTTAIAADASSGCATRLTGYLNPQLAISLSSTYVYPDSVAWQAGTRTVICEVRATSGDLTGSVRGASATAG